MTPAGPLRVALVGNPNAGKTTLFNALTGLRQKVANYPGVTVERKEGWAEIAGQPVHVLDLPGIYSLSARSPEEQIAARVLRGQDPETGTPDVLLAIVDATNLERHLYLVSQLMDEGRPVVLALNMMDLARKRRLAIDVAVLSRELGIPVMPISASKGEGLEDLKKALISAPPPPARRWRFSGAVEAEFQRLKGSRPAGEALDALTGRSAEKLCEPGGTDWAREEIQSRYAWIREACSKAVDRRVVEANTFTERLDAVLTHRVAGLAIFLALMLLVFQAIFSWARLPMDAIQAGVNALGSAVEARMAEGPLRSLLSDGVIQGVGAVVVFLPQILCLFLFIAILEDSGYMSRAAFLMDRLMRGVGLHGKSFIPLVSSFACAVPGIMATRTIENRKDRFATILVAPLMSCSARLPVYTLMIGAFIPLRYAALTMLSMYVLGMAAAFAMARLFKSTLLKGPPPPFILELPDYRMPAIRGVVLSMWDRSKQFLLRAGTVILAISVVLWALAYYPRTEGKKAPMANSYVGRMGHWIEPAIRPLGMDWKLGVGLVTSFAAREVLVTTMSTIYGVSEDDAKGLQAALRRDYRPLVGVSVMVFFVLACQCMSTLAVVRRETGGWAWPAFMFGYMTVLAWLGSFAVWQIGSRL